MGAGVWGGWGPEDGKEKAFSKDLSVTPLLGKGLVIFVKQLSETVLACAHAFIWGRFECIHFVQGEQGYLWTSRAGRSFQINENNWLDFGVLRMPRLHG